MPGQYVELIENYPGSDGKTALVLTDWSGRVRTSLFLKSYEGAATTYEEDSARELASFLGREFRLIKARELQ